MDKFNGEIGKIVEVNPKFNDNEVNDSVKLDIDNHEHYWHFNWLVPMEEK